MEYLSVRDLRTSKEVWQRLKQDGEMVVTNNGKPIAVMLNVDGFDLDERLKAIRRAEAFELMREMQLQSVRNRTDSLSMEEIDAEIRLYREEKKANAAMDYGKETD